MLTVIVDLKDVLQQYGKSDLLKGVNAPCKNRPAVFVVSSYIFCLYHTCVQAPCNSDRSIFVDPCLISESPVSCESVPSIRHSYFPHLLVGLTAICPTRGVVQFYGAKADQSTPLYRNLKKEHPVILQRVHDKLYPANNLCSINEVFFRKVPIFSHVLA